MIDSYDDEHEPDCWCYACEEYLGKFVIDEEEAG